MTAMQTSNPFELIISRLDQSIPCTRNEGGETDINGKLIKFWEIREKKEIPLIDQ